MQTLLDVIKALEIDVPIMRIEEDANGRCHRLPLWRRSQTLAPSRPGRDRLRANPAMPMQFTPTPRHPHPAAKVAAC